jgi:hypothetical protein
LTTTVRSAVRALVLACAALAFMSSTASADHLMGGTIYWERDLTYESSDFAKIAVTFEGTFRRSFPWWCPTNPTVGNVLGCGAQSLTATGRPGVAWSSVNNLHMTVVSVNAAGDWITGRHTSHLFVPLTAFPITLEFRDGNRDDALKEKNHDRLEIIRTTVDIAKGTRSPRSSTLPRIYMEQGVAAQVALPSIAYDGYANIYEFSPTSDSGLVTPVPNGTAVCADANAPSACQGLPSTAPGSMRIDNGMMRWTPQLAGVYAMQFQVISVDASRTFKNATPVDLLVEVVPPCDRVTDPACNTPPAFVGSAPSITAHINQPVTWTVSANDSPDDFVDTILTSSLPDGATFTVTAPRTPGETATGTLSWTPSISQVGPSQVCLQAIDSQAGGSFGHYCATVTVVDDPPTLTCLQIPSVSARFPGFDASITATARISGTETTTLELVLFVDGTRTASANGLQTPAADVARSLVAIHLAVGHHVITMQASDGVAVGSCSTTVDVTGVIQQINFPPIPAKTLGDPPFQLVATAGPVEQVLFEVVSGPGSLQTPLGMLQINGGGTIVVKATQPGSKLWAPAEPVTNSIQVNPFPTPPTVTVTGGSFAYSATAHPATAVVKIGRNSTNAIATVTYNGSPTPPTNVGHYVVVASFDGNASYVPAAATATTTIDITPVPLAVRGNDVSRSYGAANPTFGATLTGLKGSDTVASLAGTLTLDATATANSAVGMYPITPGGLTSTNYTISFTPGTLTITKAGLTVTADDAATVYGAPLPIFSAPIDGFVAGDTVASLGGSLTFMTAATPASAPGPYAVTPAGLTSPNYTIAFVPATLTVGPAPLRVSAVSTVKPYGAPLPAFEVTYQGLVMSESPSVLAGTLAFTTPANASSAAGSYPLTPSGLTSNNYTIVFDAGSVTVQAIALTISVNDASREFGAPNPAFLGTVTGVIAGDGITASYSSAATPASPVGTYAIVASLHDPNRQLGNYAAVSRNGTLSVVDTTPPVLTTPLDVTLEATGPLSHVTFTTTALDAADGSIAPVCAPASGSGFAVGATPVLCTATDTHGNGVSRSFTVTVTDTTPPALIVPEPIVALAPTTSGATVSFAPSGSDIVDGAIAPSCTPASGSTFPMGTTAVACVAVDAHGNSRSGGFTVTVNPMPPTPGLMSGDGAIKSGNTRATFEFLVRELATGADTGAIALRVRTDRPDSDRDRHRDGDRDDDRGRGGNRDGDRDRHDDGDRENEFRSSLLTGVTFSDTLPVTPGRRAESRPDTVTIYGLGRWNSGSGYTFEATATDAGEPGRRRDTFRMIVRDSSGRVVASVAGDLTSGNIESLRLGR